MTTIDNLHTIIFNFKLKVLCPCYSYNMFIFLNCLAIIILLAYSLACHVFSFASKCIISILTKILTKSLDSQKTMYT